MSLKPPKKSDLNKAWMKKKPDRAIKIHPEKIQLDIFGEGNHTIGLFEKAKRLAENSTEETEFHAIWSNQCIELWFLLHFSFMQSDIHRVEYWPKLTEHLKQIDAGEYEKNRKDMYQVLRPYMEYAIGNAKRLNAINQGKLPSKAAPGTKVYELIEKLLPYLTENR